MYVYICSGFVFIVTLAHGIKYLSITTDPVELWASPTSRSRVEREFFDSNFEPFYRVQQIILTPKNTNTIVHNTSNGVFEFGPVFDKTFLETVLSMTNDIKALKGNDGSPTGVGLENICYAPLTSSFTGPVTVDKCTIQSPWGWFQDDLSLLDEEEEDVDGYLVNYLDHMMKCFKNPYDIDCLGTYGGPIDAAIAFGAFPILADGTMQFEKANATIITILVNNHHNKTHLHPALVWEAAFVEYMKNFSQADIEISFKAERSIEDEINRESQSDILTILVSYIIMFAYIAVSLGHISDYGRFFMDSKITLGLGGVVIVLASVVSSVGLFGFLGVPATLIIIEVIPFLVLAVGVDNIFILVQTHQREIKQPDETFAEHIGRTLGKVGPSIMLTSVSESCCFFLGALSTMPAVRAFALYAGTSLFIDYLLQITCFVSLLALDSVRMADNRYDVFCFARGSKKPQRPVRRDGLLYGFFKTFYVPFLMKKPVKASVMVTFFAWLCLSISVAPHIEIGLDQELSMPEDSFVLKYFKSLKEYLRIGPPVYFVIKGDINYSDFNNQNLICGGQYCSQASLSTQLYIASRQPNVTYIARRASR